MYCKFIKAGIQSRARPALFLTRLLVALSLVSSAAASVEDEIAMEQGDGAMGGEYPHIPEPMLFDLVRPLGTSRGELEINMLALHINEGNIEWSPEIEYAIQDGFALELELPLESLDVQDYKFAAQYTLPDTDYRFIHGWQLITRYLTKKSDYSADFLYVSGYRFNEVWSVLNMIGLRGHELSTRTSLYGLVNLNVFYNVNETLNLGLEMNNEMKNRSWHFALMPQLHASLSRNVNLQVGAGPTNDQGKNIHWAFAGRLIYTF